MSGFAGVIRLDGQPLPDAARLRDAIAHRGGDGFGTWSDPSALFVHAMLRTTAELDPQPYVDGELAIVADLRLDNRAELIEVLGMRPSPGPSLRSGPPSPRGRGPLGESPSTSGRRWREAPDEGVPGDAALVVAAYRRWGVDSVRHLEGDFAFAIWDGRTLFCARDPFGVKPFVYCLVPGRLFAFASAVRALLAVDGVPRQFDEQRIADFLAVHFDDHERTFYRAIHRLPGGCTLALRNGDATVARYWSLEAVRPLPRASNTDYAEGFRDHFFRAVEGRMRVGDPSELGAFLSGGLDSSAIACVARNRGAAVGSGPLPVFSWIFSDVMEADERRYQEIVAECGGMTRYVLDSETAGYSPFSNLELLLPDGPPYSPNHYLNHGAARLARRHGIKTMLDGLGGDSSISRGGARPVELFVRGRFVTLARELRAISQHAGRSAGRLFLSLVIAPLLPPAIRHRRSKDPELQLLRPRIARLSGASRSHYRPHFSTRSEHLAHLRSPMLAEGLELFDRVMAAAGVEGRYPFFDRRLVEYCLSLPSDQKLADGFSRVVARRALEGVLPDAVRWRAGKGLPGLHIIPSLRANRERLDELFLQDPAVLEPYVNMDVLRATYRDFREGRPTEFTTVIRLWSAAALGYWLRLA